MKIQVKPGRDARHCLIRANVPTWVVDAIQGKEFEADASLNIQHEWLGQQVTWCLPPDAVMLLQSVESGNRTERASGGRVSATKQQTTEAKKDIK